MAGSIGQWLALVTSEHADKPKLIAALSVVLQPMADNIDTTQQLYLKFDIDLAVGVQLDILGRWIGRTRQVAIPNVYFSLDVAGLGFDDGYLKGPFDPDTYLTSLDDDHYRILLKAAIVNNNWDGSIPDAYTIWDTLLADQTGLRILIQDTGQMTMYLALERTTGVAIDAVTLAMFNTGEISIRPSGVDLQYYIVQNVPGQPLFGLDVENASISGFDVGGFGTETRGG